MGKYITGILLGLFFINLVVAQQVWPVQVTGAMIPPHSLNLGVYGAERANDLTFNAMLKDPVQASLDVRLSLSIEQNGNVIYQTDPNYIGVPLTLNQFQNILIDGNALRSYLNKEALTGANRTGTGSLEIPEGFNQICLQVYGLERNVPVSNKFCVSGNFRLNQPPQFVKPACGEKIKIMETQNMIFNWSPMHLGSPNSPGAVEYEFELVQLPQGTFNANDAFDSALKVYRSKSLSPSLFYSQAEPKLIPGVVYAWRVKAASVLHPTSKLFQNDGLSQICTFMMYDGEKPTDDINPIDNPAPRGCEVFNTEYSPIDRSETVSQSLIEGDVIKVGYFNMKVQRVTGGPAGYSGEGLVEYPMLKSLIPVTFQGVMVNSERRVFMSDRIEAVVSPSCALSEAQLNKDQIAQHVTSTFFKTKLLPEIRTTNAYVADFDANSFQMNKLPMAIRNGEDNPYVYVVGALFTPSNAYLHLVSEDSKAGNAIYAATAIPSTPFGVRNGSHLVPISAGNLALSASKIPTILTSLSISEDSKVKINCNGIYEMKLGREFKVNPDVIQKTDYKPVNLTLSEKKEDVENYYGNVSSIDYFIIPGIKNIIFSAEGGLLNLSENKSLEFPSDIKPFTTGSDSKGLLLQGLKAQLPEKFNLSNSKDFVLNNGHLFINNETIKSAKIYKNDIVKWDEGIADKWKYSVDEMYIVINDGVFKGPVFNGQFQLPVATNRIPYQGHFDLNNRDKTVMEIETIPTVLDVDMWKSKMTLNEESIINAEIKNVNNKNTFLPKANLSGVLTMSMDGQSLIKSTKGNSAEILANLQSVFKIGGDINSFSIEGIEIPHWNIDPYTSKEKKYTSGTLRTENAKLTINNQTFPVSSSKIKYENENDKERLGLVITSFNGNNVIEMTIWSREDKGQFVFDYIEQNKILLNCDCLEGASLGSMNDRHEMKSYAGSLANYAIDESSENEVLDYNKLLVTELNDFVLRNNNTILYWPLLDKELKVTKTGNSVVTHEEVEINTQLFSKLGFKVSYNIPSDAIFKIIKLEIDNWKESGAVANVTFQLISRYDEKDEKKVMHFNSEKVQALGNSIKIENVDLYLIQTHSYETWECNNYSWNHTNHEIKPEHKNLARIDCTSGFKYYQMNGTLHMKDMVDHLTNNQAKLAFKMNSSQLGNTHSLTDFIGTVLDYQIKESEKWVIHLKENPHLNFTTDQSYTIYFDNSASKKIPGEFTSKSYKSANEKSFKGVVFSNIVCEIIGLKNAEKKQLRLPVDDMIYVFSDDKYGLYSEFEKSDIIKKADKAKIEGWPYSLENASYNIQKSAFLYELELKGEISIPIFKQNPDNIKSVKFDTSWVEFTANIYSVQDNGKTTINSFFEFDDIALKTYQSDFIPGLGMVLNDDSNLQMNYNNTTKEWELEGTFSGLGIVLLTSQTAKAYGLKNFPDGMDFSLHCLTFESFNVNKQKASASKEIIDETGIKSIEFGNWGVVDYASYFKDKEKEDDKDESKEDENKGKEPEVSKVSGRIVNDKKGNVAVKSTASGKIIKTKEGIKQVSTASGSVKRVKKANTTSQNNSANTAKADTEPEFNSLKFGVECHGVKAIGNGYELGIGVTLSLLGDNKEKTNSKDSKGKATGEVKTCGLNAKGGVGLEFKRNNGRWEPSGINFNCLALDGSIGPLEFEGGLNLLRTPKDSKGNVITANNHGSGFKAYLSATILGLGGIQAVGQFGKMPINNNEGYHYGFIDLEAFKQSGFAIPPPSPGSPPIIDLYGGGGGVRINMKSANQITELVMKKDSEIAPANDCPLPEAKYLEPGVGFSQNYMPEKGTYGGNFYLILGPWNELDNQNPPVYSMIAEPGLDMEISTDAVTGDLQFRKISINVNGYFKPASLAKRRNDNVADAYAKLELNLADRNIIGAFGMRMKVDAGLKSPLIQIPEDYSSTNFNTKANYVGGKIVFSFDNRSGKKPFFNFKFGGSSVESFKSRSGLPYNTAKLNLNDIIEVTSGMYFQLGADVDDMPPLKALIPNLNDDYSSTHITAESENKNIEQSKGAGISFGFRGTIKGKSESGPLTGNFNVGLGFNVSMKEMNGVTCGNNNFSQIGIKGWYAKGQAFGYANCNVNLAYNFLFASGRVNIMTANAFLTLQAMAPNPSYFKGRVSADYSVLDGLLSGSFNLSVELGKKCENLTLPSPLVGINIFDQANIVDGQSNVDRYSDITMATFIPIGKEFNAPQVDNDGNPLQTETFIAEIKEIKLIEDKKSLKVKSVQTLSPNKKRIILTMDEPLLPETNYRIEYSFVWKKKVNGKYIEDFEKDKKPKIESGTIKFKTGLRPTKIVQNMVEYMAPGEGQRYWHAGYADTEIKFKLKAVNDAAHLFPDVCEACSGHFEGVTKFKYYVKLKEFDQAGNVKSTTTYPITSKPSLGVQDKILVSESRNVANYKINVLAEKNVPVSKVTFPDLKNKQLTKGSMYELTIIKEPDVSVNKSKSLRDKIDNKPNTDKNALVTVNKERDQSLVLESKAKEVIQNLTEILHTSYFAVSNYNNIQEKLKLVEVKHIKSTVKRRDFQHPNDVYDKQRSAVVSKMGEHKFHSVRDDYYAFTIKNNNLEGLDKFDILKLKRNVTLNYSEDYIPEKRLYSERYNGSSLPQTEIANKLNTLSCFNGIGGYLSKVLFNYTKAEKEGSAKYGDLTIGDGTKWGYSISGPTDVKCMLLQPDEIAAKKVIHKIQYKSKSDPNYDVPVFEREVEFDLLLQDYRSRIIINQMAILASTSCEIMNHENLWGTNTSYKRWLYDNFNLGFFVQSNRRINDFSWVLWADKDNKVSSKNTFIASEPGYQFSYHGETVLKFPDSNDWKEMVESKRDKGSTSTISFSSFKPNRSKNTFVETMVTSPTELVENYWYKIKSSGTELSIGDKKQAWTKLFGVGQPYQNFSYGDSQYGLYSLGGGGWPTIRAFRSIEDPMSKNENIWNIARHGSKNFLIINERYKNHGNADTKYFPKVMDHKDFKFNKKNRTPSDFGSTNDVEIIEMSGVIFSPEKYYHISDHGKKLTDKKGSDKWKILQEGKFMRFQSSNGYILKIDHYEHFKLFGSNTFSFNLKVDDTSFPGNKFGDPNGYYRSVWAVIPESPGSKYYFIKNARYASYFLNEENGKFIVSESSVGDQVIIEEAK